MTNHIDLTGQKFGKLTVKQLAPKGLGRRYYTCSCECGKETLATAHSLQSGHKVSCGCAQRESIQKTMVKHGMSRAGNTAPEYNTYMAMIQRCYNPKSPNYPNYGGRKDVAIYVKDEWRGPDGFKNFTRDMGPRPSDKHSIGRLDNNGPYGPGLCEWQDKHTQSRNTRMTVLITHNGKTLCIADWAKEMGLTPTSMRKRFHKWGVERALTTRAPSARCSGDGVNPITGDVNQS